MRHTLSLVSLALMLVACVNSEERELAVLEKELGLDTAPYFPKCLSEEVLPRAALVAGDHNVSHTVNNPQGDVPIDRCTRWETNEPIGGEQRTKKLVLKKPEKTVSPPARVIDPEH